MATYPKGSVNCCGCSRSLAGVGRWEDEGETSPRAGWREVFDRPAQAFVQARHIWLVELRARKSQSSHTPHRICQNPPLHYLPPGRCAVWRSYRLSCISVSRFNDIVNTYYLLSSIVQEYTLHLPRDAPLMSFAMTTTSSTNSSAPSVLTTSALNFFRIDDTTKPPPDPDQPGSARTSATYNFKLAAFNLQLKQ